MQVPIQIDEATRRFYANDASIYEELPAGVSFPRSGDDLIELVRRAAAAGQTLTARAGGTSLAGQAIGKGWVVDVSRHLDRMIALDAEARLARVEPGVIRDSLNRWASAHGLHFAPDTSTTDRCAIGGMIGNNSAGIYSVRHGSTRQHVRALKAVLSDGSVAIFEPLSADQLAAKQHLDGLEGDIYRGMLRLLHQHADLIRRVYPHPEIKRRNTGYALDALLEMQPFVPAGRAFNLAEFLCGSEGTLALTLEAEVRLTPLPAHRVLLVPHFARLDSALEASVLAVEAGCAAAELLDRKVLAAALGNRQQAQNRRFVEGDPQAMLVIEFQGESEGQVLGQAEQLAARLKAAGAYAVPVIASPEGQVPVWQLRKAGLGLLMGARAGFQTPEFIEDTAVRVADLPGYMRDVSAIMAKEGVECVYYGHASVGEIHLRPELDLTRPEGQVQMERIAAAIADLVAQYRGSLSGEHGDGRVRAPFIERAMGTEIIPVLEAVKRLWDPQNLLNPGRIVHPAPFLSDLRTASMFSVPSGAPVPTGFRWRAEGGLGAALGRCNGAGVCRKLAASGGVMCPSYMATREERDSTRGRANLFRQLFRGTGANLFGSEDLEQALSLCLSCKACKTECPASVDMAKMKAEFLHGRQQRMGLSHADRVLGRPEKALALASTWPWLARKLVQNRHFRAWMQRKYGIHPLRELPVPTGRPFSKGQRSSGAEVLILPDIWMNYLEPEIGRDLVRVLEAVGFKVGVLPPLPSIRARISVGLLDEAKALLKEWVELLWGQVQDGATVIGAEPSEVLTFRDEALDLLEDEDLEKGAAVSAKVVIFEEFMFENADRIRDRFDGRGQVLAVHGHCHVKALADVNKLLQVLLHCGYRPSLIEAGCCGMAGKFGYETRTYEVSMQIGELQLFPAARALPASAGICAHGFSCREQIKAGTGRVALHPAQWLAAALKD